jgi:hypothetical protein
MSLRSPGLRFSTLLRCRCPQIRKNIRDNFHNIDCEFRLLSCSLATGIEKDMLLHLDLL